MSKDFAGFIKAHCPGKGKDGKPRYITMGSAYKDSATGNVSFKIDSLPIEGSGWSGWCNVFQENEMDRSGARPATGTPSKSRFTPQLDEDDIPF